MSSLSFWFLTFKSFFCFHLHILEILSASPLRCHAVICAHLTQGHMLSCKTPNIVCVCVCIRLSNRAMQTVSSTTTESDRGRQLLPQALWLRKQLSASYIIWCCLELFRPRVKTLLSETQRWVAQIEGVTKLVKSGGARGADGLNRNACVSYTDEPIMEL